MTNDRISFTCTCYKAADAWGSETAKGLLLAMRDAGAGKDRTADMVWHLLGLRASEGAVVAITEAIISNGIPSKTEARHFVAGYAAKARREATPTPAQGVPVEPSLDAWMRHYDAFQAEMAVYGRCD
jgi:hypothetical protein